MSDPQMVSAFLSRIALADARGHPVQTAFRGGGHDDDAGPPPVDFTTGGPQAVAAGSQLVEFSDEVPADLRSAVANALLLAQLAANKQGAANSEAWYSAMLHTLGGIGWTVSGGAHGEQTFHGSNVEVHQALVALLPALLGPLAAATLIPAALKAISSLAGGGGWITLFDRESRHGAFTGFQIARVTAPAGQPQVATAFFTLSANADRTQVLFVKVGATDCQLDYRTDSALASADLVRAKAGAIAALLSSRIDDFLAEVKI